MAVVDEEPESPFWFITIRYVAPDESPQLDIGELDPWHAVGLLEAAVRYLHDCLPEFEPSGIFADTEDDDD